MLVFPCVHISAGINNRAEIPTKGNTNIKNSLIRVCDTGKNRTEKVRLLNNTHKRKHSLRDESFITSWGGAVIFTYNVQICTTPLSHWKKKKKTRPPRFMTKMFGTPPSAPNSQYSSPQTQSFISAININIATTYLKIACLL